MRAQRDGDADSRFKFLRSSRFDSVSHEWPNQQLLEKSDDSTSHFSPTRQRQ